MKPVEDCCWANRENSIPDSAFFSPASLFVTPPSPPKEKPANGLGLSSDFFSSDGAFGAKTGVGLLLKEKPAKGLGLISGFFSSKGFSDATAEVGVLEKENPPKIGLVSTTDLGVPKIEPDGIDGVGVTPTVVDGVTLVVVSVWPLG